MNLLSSADPDQALCRFSGSCSPLPKALLSHFLATFGGTLCLVRARFRASWAFSGRAFPGASRE